MVVCAWCDGTIVTSGTGRTLGRPAPWATPARATASARPAPPSQLATLRRPAGRRSRPRPALSEAPAPASWAARVTRGQRASRVRARGPPTRHRTCCGGHVDARSRADGRRCPGRLPGGGPEAPRRAPGAAEGPLALRDRHRRLGGRHQRLDHRGPERPLRRGDPRGRPHLERPALRAGGAHRLGGPRAHRSRPRRRPRPRRACSGARSPTPCSTPRPSRRCCARPSRRGGSPRRSVAATSTPSPSRRRATTRGARSPSSRGARAIRSGRRAAAWCCR